MSNDFEKSISGTVHYLLRIELPTNSTLHVHLLDVTSADAPAKELARQVNGVVRVNNNLQIQHQPVKTGKLNE